jgi:hypothetical protein
MDDESPILDEEDYSTWTIEMGLYLKTMGVAIWKAISKRAWDNSLPPRIYG